MAPMKTILLNGTVFTRLCCMLLAFMLSASAKHSYANNSADFNSLTSSAGDSIVVQKKLNSRKHKIKLYPDAEHEVLFFSASGTKGRRYQLFLFDIDGRLIKQINIKNKQISVLNKVAKGTYIFEVFSDDERIENGQVWFL